MAAIADVLVHFYFWALIILFISCIFWSNKLIKKNNQFMIFLIDKQNQELKSFVETIVSKNNYNLLQNIKEDTSTPVTTVIERKTSQEHLLQVFKKIQTILSDDLYRTMMKTNACRIAVYLFHNGTKTPTGFNFVKISCIGDKCQIGSGIKERILSHSNMPINLFDDMYDKLIDNGYYIIIRDANSGIMDTAKSEFLSAPKIQYSQAVCIYDFNNTTLGFILAEFEHAWDADTANTERERIVAFCKRLSPIFSYNDYANLTLKIPDESNEKE